MPVLSAKQLRLTVLALFLLNFAVGILLINEGLFHHDSVLLAKAVEDVFRTGRLQPAFHGRYASVAINTVLYLPFFIFGSNADLSVRLSSVLFHALSIV